MALIISEATKRETSRLQKIILNDKSEKTTTGDNERIRGHSQLQGKHKAFEEVFGQLWDLLREDLADEGDELVILVTQRGELESTNTNKKHSGEQTLSHRKRRGEQIGL